MDIRALISTDKEVMGGQVVFAGTRVPIETLFDHLEEGVSLDEFLSDFPTVSREQTVGLLDIANKMLTSNDLEQLYAAVA